MNERRLKKQKEDKIFQIKLAILTGVVMGIVGAVIIAILPSKPVRYEKEATTELVEVTTERPTVETTTVVETTVEITTEHEPQPLTVAETEETTAKFNMAMLGIANEQTAEESFEKVTESTVVENTVSKPAYNNWDAVKSWYNSLSELDQIAHLIYAEAGGESSAIQLAVGTVALNRVKHAAYPDTLVGVVFDRKFGLQYACTVDGNLLKDPSTQAYENARKLLNGYRSLGADYVFQAAFQQGYNQFQIGDVWFGTASP